MRKFEELIMIAVANGYSDVHVTGGMPCVYRKDGIIYFDKSPAWSPGEVDTVVAGLLTRRQKQILKNRWSIDVAVAVAKTRLRINIFNTTRGLSLAIRILPSIIPSLRALNLHPSLQAIAKLKSGLVLICGPTGSGKSTTISALLEEINQSRAAHIITLEDPIEFRFQNKKAFIEQREIGRHVPSFTQGLADALRESPDVILVGEIREPETVRLSLSAAESGHLVFATLHATDTEDAIYRLSSSTGGEGQELLRHKIASTISWLIVQNIVLNERLGFRVPILSIMRSSTSIKSIIRENKLAQLETAMHTSRNEGMFTMERYLDEFINAADTSFLRPYKILTSSGTQLIEEDYTSTLVDYDTAYDMAPAAPLDSKSPLPYYDPAGFGHYEIDDAVNLEELIAQIDNFKRP